MGETRHVLTILAVIDLPPVLAFYRRAFAWPQPVDTPVYAEFLLPGGQRVGLYQRDGFARNTGAAPIVTPVGALAPTELYFHCADLPDAIARLTQAGARVLSARAPRPWGDDVAYFADPEGNVLALAAPTEIPQ